MDIIPDMLSGVYVRLPRCGAWAVMHNATGAQIFNALYKARNGWASSHHHHTYPHALAAGDDAPTAERFVRIHGRRLRA